MESFDFSDIIWSEYVLTFGSVEVYAFEDNLYQGDDLIIKLPLRVRKSPIMAITLSLAVFSTCSPRRVLTWDSLLKTGRETSRHRSQAEAVVCSFTKGDAILKT